MGRAVWRGGEGWGELLREDKVLSTLHTADYVFRHRTDAVQLKMRTAPSTLEFIINYICSEFSAERVRCVNVFRS